MAATDLGRRLTERHRQAQVANQQTFLAEFLSLWGLLDVADLDATAPGWLQAVLRLLDLFREQSAGLAVDYYQQFRDVEAPAVAGGLSPVILGAAPSTIRADRRVARGNRGRGVDRRQAVDMIWLDWSDNDRAARTSLIVTGPVGIKTKIRRAQTPDQAARVALVEASGAASRQIFEGGRKAMLTVIDRDDVALGWARVTDSDPCYFCAMLASRGPVYGSRRQAGFEAHDHCGCTAEPVFSRDAAWPGRGREFQQLWNDNIRGQHSGMAAVRAWRRLYERQQRDQQRELVA